MARKMKEHASGRQAASQAGSKQVNKMQHGTAGENQDGKFI
jgi:hypothetical protein